MRLLVDCKLAPCSHSDHDRVRNGQPVAVADKDRSVWHESIAARAFLNDGRGARVEFGRHGGGVCGEVFQVVPSNGWHHCEMVVNVDEATAAQIRPGVPVSMEAQILLRDQNPSSGVRCLTMLNLDAVAIVPGQLAVYDGAKVTAVRELGVTRGQTATGGVDWRSVLPREWAEGIDVAKLPADPPVSISDSRRGLEWRWTGTSFVASGRFSKAA